VLDSSLLRSIVYTRSCTLCSAVGGGFVRINMDERGI
jgi:hypothetical protein